MAHLAASTNGAIVENAFRAGISNWCTASGVNGEDTANVRGLAAAVSRGSIANATIRRRRTVAIIASANESSTAVAALGNVRRVIRISGMS